MSYTHVLDAEVCLILNIRVHRPVCMYAHIYTHTEVMQRNKIVVCCYKLIENVCAMIHLELGLIS